MYKLTHALHDPAHCLAPGLFQSLKKGDRKKLKLDLTYSYGEDSIRFWGPEPLGADDLQVLQGLIAMSAVSGYGGRGLILSDDTKSEAGQQLRLLLDLKWEAIDKDSMVAKCSFRDLAKEIGYKDGGGSQLKTIRDCIERLWAVSIIVDRNGKRQGFRMLADYASDEEENKLFVALNPRLTEAILGKRPHTRIDMDEIRSLKTDSVRLIHQRLCGWIDPGKSGKVDINTLCSYVWIDEVSDATLRQRKSRIRNSLKELDYVGWKVTEYVRSKFEIRRPKKP